MRPYPFFLTSVGVEAWARVWYMVQSTTEVVTRGSASMHTPGEKLGVVTERWFSAEIGLHGILVEELL